MAETRILKASHMSVIVIWNEILGYWRLLNVSREDKIANVMIRDRVQRQTTVIDIIKREGNYRCLNTLAGPTTTHFFSRSCWEWQTVHDHKKDLQEGGETTLATGAGVAFLQRRLHTTRTVLSLSMMLDCLMCVCRIITKIMDRWMDSSCTHQGWESRKSLNSTTVRNNEEEEIEKFLH